MTFPSARGAQHAASVSRRARRSRRGAGALFFGLTTIVGACAARDGSAPARAGHTLTVAAAVDNPAGIAPTLPPPRAPSAPPVAAAPAAPCPEGMVLVEGAYCPDVRQVCLKWMDPPGPYAHLRCARFRSPARCAGSKEPMRFCVDQEEHVDEGQELPRVGVSWTDAVSLCEAAGKHLCTEREWELACEGPAMLPYPYGFSRDSSACNIDRTDLGRPNGGLIDHRAPPGSFPRCESPYGVLDMTGNVDEWTVREDAKAPHRSALHGGWWLPGRNNCRAATLGHFESYAGKQVGFRCCADPS